MFSHLIPDGFMPHGHCFLWIRELLALHVLSDGVIALAYYSIPIGLFIFAKRRQDLQFRWVFIMFAAFILACGTTHLLAVWTVWVPGYWVSGTVKAMTAAVSAATAVALWMVIPTAVALPSPAQLRRANDELRREVEHRRQVTRALAESEIRFRCAFEHAPIGMGLLAPDGSWLRVNDALCELVGHPATALVGADLRGIIHPDDLTTAAGQLEQLLSGASRSWVLEQRYLHRSGRAVWVLLTSTLVRDTDGEPQYFIVQIQDITERRRMEQALQEANAALEQRVAERTAELEEMHRRKDEFLATLAHELRNPMAAIRNAVAVLHRQPGLTGDGTATPLKRAASPQEAPLPWAVALIDRQSDQLRRMVDDLLDVARIMRGRIILKREPVPVAEIVAEAVDTTRHLVERRSHALEVDLPPTPLWVDGDRVRLVQVLTNLLNNAAKYTRPGGHIRVRARRHDEALILSVRDNGEGLHPDHLDSVFEVFYQGERSLARSGGGLGLGLSLVARLVQMHGGSVQAQSPGPGCGSEFSVRLPLCPAPDEADRAVGGPGEDRAPHARRVLVVDDNPDVAESLARLVEALGYPVETAGDGEAALERVRAQRPDLVLLDIGLPGMDGYETARRLRTEHGTALRLVAITGYGMDSDRDRSRAAGFDRHLLKPVSLEELRAVLEERAEIA